MNKNTLLYRPMQMESRLAHLIMAEKGIFCDKESMGVVGDTEMLRTLNPVGNVPVLMWENDVVCGVYPIMEYLEDMSGNIAIFGQDIRQRAESRRLIDIFLNGFHASVVYPLFNERLLKRFNRKNTPDTGILIQARKNMQWYFKYMEKHIEERGCLHFNTVSVADFTAAAGISTLDYLDEMQWHLYPELRIWYARIKSRESFTFILKDNIPHITPPVHYADIDF